MTAVSTKTARQAEAAKGSEKSSFNKDALAFLNSGASGTVNMRNRKRPNGRVRGMSQRALYASKVKAADLILFTTQLSVMLDSGVVLSDALDAIAEQTEYGTFKMIIMDISEKVKSGDNFSKALTYYPRAFNSMFISMVKASEASGRMVEMLTVLSDYLNFESQTRKQVKGALTYPFIMVMMAIAATGTLMFFVLPRFMRIYEAKGAALPKLTQILVGFSKILGDVQAMTAIVTGLIVVSMGLYWWIQTPGGKKTLDFVKIKTPVLGSMFVDVVITRSMRIMATMINTGVSLLEAIEVIQGSCENYYFHLLWLGVDEKIRDGYQLSESILTCRGGELIAPGVIQMLRAGEKSGKLGNVCGKISAFYEKKLEASIKSVMTLIEPLMIIILGGIIGTIAIALLMPVFRISSVIAH